MWRLRAANGSIFRVGTLPATVGSGPGADVVIAHASVLAEHARLRDGGNGSLVIEAAGDAPVGVGRRRVQVGELRHGEELVLGRLILIVERETGPAAESTTELAAEPPLVPRRAPAAARAAAGPAAGDEQTLAMRGKSLRFSRQPQRRGLLHADLSQLSGGTRLALLVGAVAGCAGLVWGIAALMGVLH